jgi:hypothetical protein
VIVTITNVFKTEDANFQGLHRTWFNADNKTLYILHKPGNAPKTGDTLEGSIKEDARRNLKFTKEQQSFAPASPAPGPQMPSTPAERVFKADPARQSSIEWQASIKAAVDAVRDFYTFSDVNPTTLEDYKRSIVNTAITFAAVVEMKPNQTIEPKAEPIGDTLPTEEQVAAAFGTGEIDLTDNPLGDMGPSQ